MSEEYIHLGKLIEHIKTTKNKERISRVLDFSGMLIAGTFRELKFILLEIFRRTKLAKKRSGFGIHHLGKGENFGLGFEDIGVKLNQADPFGYHPPQRNPSVIIVNVTQQKTNRKKVKKK